MRRRVGFDNEIAAFIKVTPDNDRVGGEKGTVRPE